MECRDMLHNNLIWEYNSSIWNKVVKIIMFILGNQNGGICDAMTQLSIYAKGQISQNPELFIKCKKSV